MISTSQADHVGMSRSTRRRRHNSSLLVPVQPGVWRSATHPDTWHGRLAGACLSTGGLASHRSAAVLWGFDAVRSNVVEITVAKSSARARSGVVIHESTQMHLARPRKLAGIPVTGPARTLLDLGAVVPAALLENAVDDALRQRKVTWSSLYEVLVQHATRGRRGCRPMRLLLDERYGDRDIPLSTWSRQVARLLMGRGLPRPELEFRISGRKGELLAQVDLAYPAELVAIELQSKRWHLNQTSFEQDPLRWNRLTNLGWRVYPITWSYYVDQPTDLCRTVATALAGAGTTAAVLSAR